RPRPAGPDCHLTTAPCRGQSPSTDTTCASSSTHWGHREVSFQHVSASCTEPRKLSLTRTAPTSVRTLPGARAGLRGSTAARRVRARRGDVRLALLLLLGEQPRNGYQLMQAIEDLSGGRWRPSPGSIYPTLAQLEDQHLIRATEADGTKLFELTDAGRRHLDEHHHSSPPWVDEDEPEAFQDLRSQLKQLHVAAVQL